MASVTIWFLEKLTGSIQNSAELSSIMVEVDGCSKPGVKHKDPKVRFVNLSLYYSLHLLFAQPNFRLSKLPIG